MEMKMGFQFSLSSEMGLSQNRGSLKSPGIYYVGAIKGIHGVLY